MIVQISRSIPKYSKKWMRGFRDAGWYELNHFITAQLR